MLYVQVPGSLLPPLLPEAGYLAPLESALCLVPVTFSPESRALGQKFIGLMILSHFDKGRMGRIMRVRG